MKILVFGANGLVGSNLVKLLSASHHVFAVVKNKTNLHFQENKNITMIEMNLSIFDGSMLPMNIDAVYYLAQSNFFREFPDELEDILYINTITPNLLAKWSIDKRVKKFFYASSGGVYDPSNEPLHETLKITLNKEHNFYIASKLSAEILLRNFASMFETFVIIRPFFIYGEGQNKSMLIPRLIAKIMEKHKIILNGEEGIKINPIYVTDAAEAIMNLLILSGEHVINIAGKEIVSIKKLCLIMENVINEKAIFEHNESQSDLVADIGLMNKMLHTPKVNLYSGISKIVNTL